MSILVGYFALHMGDTFEAFLVTRAVSPYCITFCDAMALRANTTSEKVMPWNIEHLLQVHCINSALFTLQQTDTYSKHHKVQFGWSHYVQSPLMAVKT